MTQALTRLASVWMFLFAGCSVFEVRGADATTQAKRPAEALGGVALCYAGPRWSLLIQFVRGSRAVRGE